jgi:hypothetical protein
MCQSFTALSEAFNIVRHNLETSILDSQHYREYRKATLLAAAHFGTTSITAAAPALTYAKRRIRSPGMA